MFKFDKEHFGTTMKTYSSPRMWLALLLLALVSLPLSAQQNGKLRKPADHQFLTIESPPSTETASVVTWKGGQDHRWSNPGNWEGGRVPGTSDAARFAAGSSSEVLVDADSPGTVADLILEPDYHGKLSLRRDLTVSNDLD